LAKTR